MDKKKRFTNPNFFYTEKYGYRGYQLTNWRKKGINHFFFDSSLDVSHSKNRANLLLNNHCVHLLEQIHGSQLVLPLKQDLSVNSPHKADGWIIERSSVPINSILVFAAQIASL